VQPRVGGGACTALAPSALAEEGSAARKFGRGLAGVTLGVLEIPGNIVQEGRTNGALSAATVGLAMGLGKFVAREVIGVYELLTTPFPIPADFEPVLAPEFPWQYFDSEPGRAYGFSDTYLSEEAADLQQIPGAVVARRQGALIVQFPSDLLFAFDSATLLPTPKTRLGEVAEMLHRYPDAQIQVLGYTDATGTDDHNLALSSARADAVRRYLVEHDVEMGRIASVGYGEAAAIASNQTAEGRRQNRRVEIQVRAGGVAAYR